jgi:hypothetical protein
MSNGGSTKWRPNDPSRDEIVAQLVAYHQELDRAMAILSIADSGFRPSKSPMWAAVESGYRMLRQLDAIDRIGGRR